METPPIPGDIEVRFNRTYIVVNPNAALGPPVYRLSNPDEIAGGGGGTVAAKIDGVAPIVATTDSASKETQISMDIKKLDKRNP